MSYCRWSSLDGYSDVYVYADVSGGWTTHVAGNRLPKGAPQDPVKAGMDYLRENPGDEDGASNVVRKASEARKSWMSENPYVHNEHAEAGDSFNHPTPGECADNLERLEREGFIVPERAIERLREEHAELYPMEAGK